ncbi:hypothetical protein TNCV_654201 [Trichonephila clavipes]|nr:hypothetical protein TNCV_654201 [Trichonephila clavipes]
MKRKGQNDPEKNTLISKRAEGILCQLDFRTNSSSFLCLCRQDKVGQQKRMSDGRKRLSGAQYKRKGVEKQVQIKKQAGSLLSYLQGMKRNEDDTGILEAASNLNYEADQDTRNPLPRIVSVELTPRTYKESTPGTSTESNLGTSTETTPEISK